MPSNIYNYSVPTNGRFGPYGGRYVPETLMETLLQLERDFLACRRSPDFRREFKSALRSFAGRPTPLYRAQNLEKLYAPKLGTKPVIYFKREDLCHTGAHKINNCIGQALLARRSGKRRIVAETGAGQHGVATAAVCAHFGLECIVYMGTADIVRQAPNVTRMRLLGARVVPVDSGSRTLKDAINEAIRDWVTNVETTHYLLGSAVGPHPYPLMVREFQSVIGREALRQSRALLGKLPDAVVACVGGGSNAIGSFAAFIPHRKVRLFGVEAGGCGLGPGRHSATVGRGRPGVLHGCHSLLLQDGQGQVLPTHSISAGLDYPGVGPEHAWLKELGRVKYLTVNDRQALKAFHDISQYEGILPALESSHAVAAIPALLKSDRTIRSVLVTLSGRGDKDVPIIEEAAGCKQ